VSEVDDTEWGLAGGLFSLGKGGNDAGWGAVLDEVKYALGNNLRFAGAGKSNDLQFLAEATNSVLWGSGVVH
jgi:hypothetical protein